MNKKFNINNTYVFVYKKYKKDMKVKDDYSTRWRKKYNGRIVDIASPIETENILSDNEWGMIDDYTFHRDWCKCINQGR